ncbi:hypothetical protein ILYODFUR_035431 [Ilyodon furcidens]|uniref:Uncharacterized protein n=1 Tax=Ilyodon furcidens TaxID=33524 RepID=A0ABV0TE16_9TELE
MFEQPITALTSPERTLLDTDTLYMYRVSPLWLSSTQFGKWKTEEIIQRLESILSVPGNGPENQQFILEVLLPKVVIQWLQRSNNMCRYQAETVLMKTKSFKENDG